MTVLFPELYFNHQRLYKVPSLGGNATINPCADGYHGTVLGSARDLHQVPMLLASWRLLRIVVHDHEHVLGI